MKFIPFSIGCAVAIAVLLANASPLLPGLHSDSIQYVEAARSLAAFRGLEIPVADWWSPDSTSVLTHYPPGFPLIMAPFVLLGLSPMTAAVLVIALSAGATVALAYQIGNRLSGAWGGILSAVLVAFNAEWFRLHTAVWSEPLYLAVMLGAVHAMVRWPEKARLHGLLGMFAFAVRYVGLSVAFGAAVIAWRQGRENRFRRLVQAVGPSLAFGILWVLFTRESGGTVRRFGVYPGWVDWATKAPGILASWLSPTAGAVVAVIAGAALLWLVGRSRVDWSGFASLALSIGASYVVILGVSRAIADPLIPMDARMLMPVFVLGAIALGTVIGASLSRGRLDGGLALVGIGLWAFASGSLIWNGVRSFQKTGQFYTHVIWAESVPVKWAEASQEMLYSNEPELLFLYTGRPARRAPVRGDDLEAWRETWPQRPGPLVMMNPARSIDLPANMLLGGLGLVPIAASAEGAVFWH